MAIDQKMRDKAAANVMKAKVQMTLHHAFFSALVMKRGIFIEDKTPTAYITKAGRIGLGTEFTAKLTVQQVVFLLAHEALHYALMHNFRRFNRDPHLWNKVCDWVINDILSEAKCGMPIPDGEYRVGASKFSAEELYKQQTQGGNGGKPPPTNPGPAGNEPPQDGQPEDSSGGDQYTPGEGNNDLSESEEPDDQSVQEIAQEIARELLGAKQAAKKQGKLPAGLERIVGEIINPITPWHILLERFMTGLIKDDVTWSRPRRKLLPQDIYLPSANKVPKMGEIVIGVDTSGSINDEMCQHFLGHINSIFEKCNPEKVHVLHVDSRVQQADEFAEDDYPIQIKRFKGGGGTDMRKIMEWIDKMGIEPDVCVTLTDGLTPFPEKEPAYPLVWLQTGDEKAPVGENITYRMEN